MASRATAAGSGWDSDQDPPLDLEVAVREVLDHLHDLPYLQTHPLTRWLGARRRSRLVGRALQRELLEGIEALRPSVGTNGESRAWRSYEVLHLRYVEGLDVGTTYSRLAISRRAFYRDRRQGIQALALILQERLEPERPVGSANDSAETSEDGVATQKQPRPVRHSTLTVLPSPELPDHNLPEPLTSFVGRERELTDVPRHLASTRLLTLTGPGGSGKTRLALEVASAILGSYPEGVWWVDLAPIANPSLAAPSIAQTLGLSEQAGHPILSTLIDYLRRRRCLLVLDNCEHLVEACATLGDALLRACPSLTVLATSREGLRIDGEVVYQVPSLSVPDPERLPPLGEILDYGGIRLFVERAVAANQGFELTASNARSIARICSRLDGLPLAIELAAARVRVLTPEEIAQRLDDRFGLLTSGSRTALPRQQTLHATVDWSYHLLAEPERRLFRRLSVFQGLFRLEDAEAVCPDAELPREQVLSLLGALEAKSLVLVDVTSGEARYRLLETIREYAWDRLASASEAEGLRAKHREWYLALGERIEPELWGPNQAAVKQVLEVEHDNLRAALGSCLQSDVEAGMRLGGSIWRFWADRGYVTEGCRWLEGLVAADAGGTGQRAWCLHALGYLLTIRGEYGRARSLMEESTSLLRALGDSRRLAWVLADLGVVPEEQGDFAGAKALFEESLAIARELGDPFCIGLASRRLARLVHSQGDFTTARILLEACLVLIRQLGNQRVIGWTLSGLGVLAQAEGDYSRARALLKQSLSIARRDEHALGVIHALIGLGNLARAEGDYEIARGRLEEGLAVARRIGSTLAPVETHACLGELARVQGDYARASAFFREGLAFCWRHRHPFTPAYLGLLGMLEAGRWAFSLGVELIGASQANGGFVGLLRLWDPSEDCGACLATAREALGDDAFARAIAEGQAMTLEQAVEYALRDDEV
jgi:predicted ATPase